MYSFLFHFENGEECYFENVTSVKFTEKTLVTVEGDKLLTYNYPLTKKLHLYSNNFTMIVNGESSKILWLKITRQN